MNLAFYLVKIGKLYKIGFTKSPVREKVSALQRSYSEKAQLVSSFQTKNGKKNEDYFNEKLAAYKVSGDWFNLPQQLIDCKKDWFKSCLTEDATSSSKGFKPKPEPKESTPVKILPPLPPFPELESFNDLLANGSDNFVEEFTKRYFAVLKAAKDRSPEEIEAQDDKWAKENMSETNYRKWVKDMAMLKKRVADRQNQN
jgi:hypothetical protein